MDLPQGVQTRQRLTATFDRASVNVEARSAELAFSSEAPVERPWGVEILGHAAGEIDTSFIGSGMAPLLLCHDADDQIGVVDSVTLGADRKMRAVVRFSRAADAEDIMQDVADGIRACVSVGYEILQAVMVSEEKGKPPVYRVTRWRPFEVSIVSIPADTTVGVGRAAEPLPPSIPAEPIPAPKEARMADPIPTTAPAAPAAPDFTEAAEAKRQKEIMALAELAGQRDFGVNAVIEGDSLELFRGKLMLARQGQQKPLGPVPSEIGMSTRETQTYSLMRAIRAAASNDWSEAGLELEAHKTVAQRLGDRKLQGKRSFLVPFEVQGRQQRDLTAASAAGGGYLVATNQLAGSFIEVLRSRSVTMMMGATRLTGLVGNVTVPKQTGAGTAYWLSSEATAITESNQTFGQMALTPKNVGAYTEISRQLMMQSDPSAEMLVMNDLAQVVALGMDAAAINGSGSSGQPQGLLNVSGIGAVTGTSLAYAGIIEFQTDVAGSDALVNPGAGGYVTTPAVAGLLIQRQRFSSTDSPLWQGSVYEGQVAGFRARSSTAMPSATAIFGDWSQLVIGEWGTLEVDVNPYANFAAGITGIRAFYTVDVGVRYGASFSAATSIT